MAGADASVASAASTRTKRVTKRSYRTAREPVYDHFGAARDLVVLEPDAVDGNQQVTPRGKLWKPRWKDDDEVWAALDDISCHPRFPFPAVGPDLGCDEA